MRKKNSRRLDKGELDISTWKYPDEGALPEGAIRNGHLSRKQAIDLYFQGANEREIKAHAGIGLSQTLRLIKERCLSVHEDGEVWGWRALVPHTRINPYQRKHKVVPNQFGLGTAGALTAVLNVHPDIRAKLIKRILTPESTYRLSSTKRDKRNHWRWLLDQLRLHGYGPLTLKRAVTFRYANISTRCFTAIRRLQLQ